MIGFFNRSVIVTYLGVALSLLGIALANHGLFEWSVFCLALAGACDTFDGKIARAMKNRTKEMMIFGTQIDSLCDMVCFGVTPAILCYHMGLNRAWGIAVEILYVLCGVIRLAYFNTLEELKHEESEKNGEQEKTKYFHGLPITSISVIFPVVYLFRPLPNHVFSTILGVMLLVVAFLFILDFKIKKPSNGVIAVLMFFVLTIMLRILHVL